MLTRMPLDQRELNGWPMPQRTLAGETISADAVLP